jgi:prepilin-type N-terminal cleavage/methylation domain-containing protein
MNLRIQKAQRGYTAIEVMLSMTVLLIGSAAVMSMQKSAIQSNLDARKLDLANAIAHTWIERLQTDATQWTLPSTNITGGSNFSNTKWLSSNAFGTWFEPPVPASYGSPGAEGNSPAFDILGRDLDAVDAPNAVFCTHMKIDQLATDSSGLPTLLRATVLVFWQKQLVTSSGTPAGNCSAWFDVAVDEAAHPGTWHIIYASTAIRKNPL